MKTTTKSFDDVVWSAASVGPAISLNEAVASSQATGANEHISVATVFTEDGHPFDHIRIRGVEAEHAHDKYLRVLRLTDAAGSWTIAAWPATQQGNVFHLVTTVHSTDSRWGRMERWIRKARGVVHTFLNTDDFEAVGTTLAEFGDVEVGRVASRSSVDGSSDTRGWKQDSGIARPNPHDVLDELAEQYKSVTTMTMHVENTLSLHLRRVAGATYYNGDFELFYNCVLTRLATAADKRRELLSGRQRHKREEPRPLRIVLPTPQFTSPESTGLVMREVGDMTNVSLAVFHRNPYLHFTVTDEVDGSNFDVMITEADAVDVYPGFRATAGALSRLTQQISARFGGEQIIDRPARTFTLDELTAGA